MDGVKKWRDVTNFVFWNKDSGQSVETELEGEEESQHTTMLEEVWARGVFKRLDFWIWEFR